MNPVAFTYDWGMVTDLARRNQARLCGKLGVEHILVSADIARKRRNVRKNVEAWLKRPDLGMVPLFMAGDKQFFYHANRLRKEMDIDLVLFCTCPLEVTHFKTGFCGVRTTSGGMYFNFPLARILRLAMYYARQYATNPGYWNSSFSDTLGAFVSAFFMVPNWLNLYDFVLWDEDTIARTLREEYDWETSPDTLSTWRIGDGTAAFYNYIYYKVAGFTEHDTFRSNQIREGFISREKAMELTTTENQPRWDSMMWYARTIGFDFAEAVKAINSIPPLYETSPETYRRKIPQASEAA
jgi:glucosamine--fructose-6-phosphate aminotransferase (isomerizing)